MKILKKWNLKDAFCRQISETDFELGNRYFCRRISLKDGGFRTIRFNGPDAINIGKADAVLAASLFHFGEIRISDLKDYLANEGIPVRRLS